MYEHKILTMWQLFYHRLQDILFDKVKYKEHQVVCV